MKMHKYTQTEKSRQGLKRRRKEKEIPITALVACFFSADKDL